jgi:uncharacterized membrane protein
MVKRNHIILIAGIVLLISGIILAGVWIISFADKVLTENIIISTAIEPFKDYIATLQVNDTRHDISIIIPSLSFGNISSNTSYNQHLENLTFTVKDSNGRQVELLPYLLGLMFKPNITGEYTLTITNKDLHYTANIFGLLFGYTPIVDEHSNVNLNLFNTLIEGVLLITIGIIVLVIGIVFTILDRRREARQAQLAN